MSETVPTPVPATCYKFVVASAEEAATLIRERLGPEARVLSVRTVETPGLRRLWAPPRLEVIARMDPPAPPSPPPSPAGRETRRAVPAARSLRDLLRRSGLSEVALGRLQAAPFWAGSETAPLHRALVEAGEHLRRESMRRWARAPLTRAAFIGAPGVGRTTALCKWLGTEVFRRGRLGHVVTVEFDRPNAAGPLPVFGEALGVPVARYPSSTQPAVPGGFVYFDLPGMSVGNQEENAPLSDFLAREGIAQRVLVLNAAYDHAALRAAYSAGRALGATHLVFTHLDEAPQWGRLWDYLFDGALEPLFLATGPSLTGDCEENVFGELVGRTLAGGAAEAPAGAPDDSGEILAASNHP
jgi:flagellar biosynthesis protein FlhF